MSEKEKRPDSKPLLYIVQPDIPVPTDTGNMQEEYRSRKKKKPEVNIVSHESEAEMNSHDPEAQSSAEEDKLERLKHEFGVYKALDEVKEEIEAVKRITEVQPGEAAAIIINNVPEADGGKIQELIEKEKKIESLDIRDTITSLLRMTKQGPPPLCEAKINGKNVRFQLLGKRGDTVKIKTGNTIQNVQLYELSAFKVL